MRISQNRKALLPGPWEQFSQTHEVGDLVEGQITSVLKYGAFVKVTQGVEGLLHQNEVNIPYGGSIEDVLRTGDSVLVQISNIDPVRKRLSLSMRRVSVSEEIAWMADRS